MKTIDRIIVWFNEKNPRPVTMRELSKELGLYGYSQDFSINDVIKKYHPSLFECVPDTGPRGGMGYRLKR